MKLRYVRFLQAISVGTKTISTMTIEDKEFKGWELSFKDGLIAVVSPDKSDIALVPFSNVYYMKPLIEVMPNESAAGDAIQPAQPKTAGRKKS